MNARTVYAIVSVLATLALACGKGEDPREYAKRQSKQHTKPRPRAQIVTIKTPVAPGAKVRCADWIDLAAFKEALEQTDDLVLDDQSKREADPTSICSIKKGGEPPSAEAQAEKFEKENYKLGVVGGDEYCLAHLFCAYVATVEDLERKCKADPMSDMGEVMGQPACIHRTQRAAQWAYKYTVIDPETTCGLEVQGGPSVTDQALVEKCTEATLTSLTKAGIAKPFMP